MISRRRPPWRMPTMPWSQPGMTIWAPSSNGNGWPRSQDASNSSPVDHDAPTYCIVSLSPAFAFRPLPLTMSLITSWVGGSPSGLTILGFLLVSFEMPATISSMFAACGVAVSVGLGVAALSDWEESSLPQATRPAPSSRARVKLRSFARKMRLRGRDSNPNYQSQNLACCQLHHPAMGGAQYRRRRAPCAAAAGQRRLPFAAPHATFRATRRREAAHGTSVMTEGGNGSIQLLEADPELARGLDPRRIREMSPRLFARAVDIPRGAWSPGRTLMGGSNPIGLLVLDGLLVREATVGDHPSAELLGPGDLLRAWEDRDAEVLLPRSVRWSALTNARVAIIDHALAVRAAQWPEIFAQLVERAARRAERLVIMQAIGHLTRVDDRLLALLWCPAGRGGRVAPDGVLVTLRLPHRTLAGMVGARRPSVTTALGQLMARGAIERRPDGGWILHGQPRVLEAGQPLGLRAQA